jgi:hypothetical protein
MGMEDEAKQLQCALHHGRVTDTLLAAPYDTD